MTLVAEKALRAHLPTKLLIVSTRLVLKDLTIFTGVFKNFWWPPEVSHMMSKYAALGVMRVFPVRTPTGLVPEHVESEHF
jgi:hypothetical protein